MTADLAKIGFSLPAYKVLSSMLEAMATCSFSTTQRNEICLVALTSIAQTLDYTNHPDAEKIYELQSLALELPAYVAVEAYVETCKIVEGL